MIFFKLTHGSLNSSMKLTLSKPHNETEKIAKKNKCENNSLGPLEN
jgi:hypothetical protein